MNRNLTSPRISGREGEMREPLVAGNATGDPVLVAIPAHNEERFIGSLVLRLRSDGYAVLVVDDGSSDRTADIAEAAGATVLRHSSNGGKASAVRTAFEYARALDVEALVVLDGDSQHDPADVPRVVVPILQGDADMVVGSRFAGIKSSIPRWRLAGQHALTFATNLGSGVRVSDSQSGFRAFSRRTLETVRFSRAGFSVESELQFEARAHDLKVAEVPISVHYQVPAKRNPFKQGLNVLDGVLRLVAQHRPLLFFGVPGVLTLLVGLALGVVVVRIYQTIGQLAVGYALITVLLFITGLLSLFIGIALHAFRGLLQEELENFRKSGA